MRKILLVITLGVFMIAGLFCFAIYKISNNSDISIKVNDSKDYYEMSASYGKDQTKRVMSFVDIALTNNKRFRSAHLNEDVEMNDHSKFHINSSPGNIHIKLNKDENDPETIEKFKKITEGIKIRLSTGQNY